MQYFLFLSAPALEKQTYAQIWKTLLKTSFVYYQVEADDLRVVRYWLPKGAGDALSLEGQAKALSNLVQWKAPLPMEGIWNFQPRPFYPSVIL